MNKEEIINTSLNWIKQNKLQISSEDLTKPWGAFWCIDKKNLTHFLSLFFPNNKSEQHNINPKILLIEANKKISLQFHHKRAEQWKIIKGPVKVIIDQKEKILNQGEEVYIKAKSVHRLCGLDNYGLVAEIWIHNNPLSPSNENDIVRITDDFGRN